MSYYFLGKYDRRVAENLLVSKGFYKREEDGAVRYINHDESFIVNLTSAEEGKMQIQGDGPEDIWVKGKNSKHFPTLEFLVKIMKPKRLVNPIVEDVFPELLIK